MSVFCDLLSHAHLLLSYCINSALVLASAWTIKLERVFSYAIRSAPSVVANSLSLQLTLGVLVFISVKKQHNGQIWAPVPWPAAAAAQLCGLCFTI